MKTLNFNENYNGKLDNDIFTTIRKQGATSSIKEDEKNEVIITLDREYYCKAKLLHGHTYMSIYEIPSTIKTLDTGIYNMADCEKLFKKFGIGEEQIVELLELKRVEN